jgi:hypothetical protein
MKVAQERRKKARMVALLTTGCKGKVNARPGSGT